jgi:hypothetical protein
MNRLVLALLLAGLLLAPGAVARAQDSQNGQTPANGAANGQAAGAAPADEVDVCAGIAGRAALPVLLESYTFSGAGMGPFGFQPLTYPLGGGPQAPLVPPSYFGGLAPSAGPLGPGVTANAIARGVLAPSGFNPTNATNAGTLVGLAALQQAELAQLNFRLANSQAVQYAAATYANSVANRALNVFAAVQNECRQRMAAVAAPAASNGSAPAAPGNGQPTSP